MIYGSQQPSYRSVPTGGVTSWGEEAIGLAESIDIILDEGQEDVVTASVTQRVNGRWLSREVVDIEPRQNGKSLKFEVRALAGLILIEEPLIVWTAHEFKTAMKSYEIMKGHFENWDHLRKRVKRMISSTHATEIQMMNGCTLSFVARSGGSGRGFAKATPLILDEAYALTQEQMAAILPIISAAPNPQVMYGSSAPLNTSAVLRSLVKRGRAGAPGVTYFEWCAQGKYRDVIQTVTEAKESDPLTLRGQQARERLEVYVAQANPAYNVRIDPESIEGELGAMGVEQFARERLGAFSELEEGGRLDPDKWVGGADPDSFRSGDCSLAVDIDVNREWSSIALYGPRPDLLGHVQIVDHRPGVHWLAGRIVELKDALNPVSIGMRRGTYASLKEVLLTRKIGVPQDFKDDRDPMFPIERGDIVVLNGTDMAAACGRLIDAVADESIRHVPQDAFDRAAAKAQTRVVGDAVTWVQTDTSVNLTPLIAATIAPWAYDARIHEVAPDYDPVGDIY